MSENPRRVIHSPPPVPQFPPTTEPADESAADGIEAQKDQVESRGQRAAKSHFETSSHEVGYVGNRQLQPSSVTLVNMVNFNGSVHNVHLHVYDGEFIRRGTELPHSPALRNGLFAPAPIAPPDSTSFQANGPRNCNSSKKTTHEASFALATNNDTGGN